MERFSIGKNMRRSIGPPLIDQALWPFAKATWIPFVPLNLTCDNPKRCCFREGFGLVVAKARTLHTLQGLEVFSGAPMERLVISTTKTVELLNTGMFYMAVSRGKTAKNIALSKSMTMEFFKTIGIGSTESSRKECLMLRQELARIRALAAATIKKYTLLDRRIGSRLMFVLMLRWLVDYCRAKHTGGSETEVKIRRKCDEIERELLEQAANEMRDNDDGEE